MALTALGYVASVQAQSPAQEESSVGKSSTSLVIDEVMVTAQKRQQALEDVPVVVSVRNSDFIRDAGIVGLEDLENYIPSLLMERKARIMIKMADELNDIYVPRLDEIEVSQHVEVRCITCHRGQQQPKLIEDVLDEQLAENGLEATLDKYAELREAFYGSHSYDFSEFTLPMYVQELAEKEKIPEAIALTKINASHFPDSYYTFFVLAELYKASRQTDLAIESYTRAIELNPRAKRFLEPKIAELNGDAQ